MSRKAIESKNPRVSELTIRADMINRHITIGLGQPVDRSHAKIPQMRDCGLEQRRSEIRSFEKPMPAEAENRQLARQESDFSRLVYMGPGDKASPASREPIDIILVIPVMKTVGIGIRGINMVIDADAHAYSMAGRKRDDNGLVRLLEDRPVIAGVRGNYKDAVRSREDSSDKCPRLLSERSRLTVQNRPVVVPWMVTAAQTQSSSKFRAGMWSLSRIGSKTPKQLGRVGARHFYV